MEQPAVGELLRAGRAALAAADLDGARSSFEQAGAREPSGAALDGLSDVVQLERDYPRAIELKEQAFAAYRREGMMVEAAAVARALTFLHATYHGNFSVAGGWMSRARSLLEDVEECAAHGWLTLYEAPFSSDPGERGRFATAALAIARRFGDVELECDALALLGESHVASGRVVEGMRMLDHAMAAVSSGEVRDHFVIGEIFCRLLAACEAAIDVRRATEWIDAVDRLVVWSDFVRPTCRTHYGGILTAVGRWRDAEAELLWAIDTFDRGYRGDRVFAIVRLAELRLRQGRFEEAERLVEECEWHPGARRAAAVIALARGQLALAHQLAALCLESTDATNPACAPLLELLLDVQLAQQEIESARETVSALEGLAQTSGLPRLEACAELATGRLEAALGEDGAVGRLARAVELFASLELPLESARARLDLARALAAGSGDAAVEEGKRALAALERLGAARDADAAADLLRRLGVTGGRIRPRGQGTLTKREIEVLALLADGFSNELIADRLVISRRTAEHHVGSILSKLDLRSRAEAAAYAVREGLRRRRGGE